jgi:hypothetical protein
MEAVASLHTVVRVCYCRCSKKFDDRIYHLRDRLKSKQRTDGCRIGFNFEHSRYAD